MTTIRHEVPPTALAALRLSPAELAREMRIAASVQWYAEGLISQGTAAEIAGLQREEFLGELYRRKVTADQATVEELREDLENV